MLLVKQNVLKNYGKLVTLFLVFVTSFPSYAVDNSSAPDFLRMIISLIIVLAIIFVLAYIVKKLKITPNSQKHLRTVTSLAVGTKERVVIVEVNNEQFMLGVTSTNVNLLHKLEQNINVDNANDKIGLGDAQPITIQSLFKKGKS